MKRLMLVVIPCLVLSACSAKNDQGSTSMSGDNSRPSAATAPGVDNSGANKSQQNYTAEQQSNNPRDLRIISELRRDVLDKDNLSVDAQNIKIISNNGKVVLRGQVATEQEKETIAELARDIDGVAAVDNQLELKNKSVAGKSGKEVR